MKEFIYSNPVPAGCILIVLIIYVHFSGRNISRDTGNFVYYKLSRILIGILCVFGYYVNDSVVKSGMFEGTSRQWDSIVGSYTCPILGGIIIFYGILVVTKEGWLREQEERKNTQKEE